MRKRFDKELHATYDTAARKFAMKLFKSLDPFTITENPKKTGVDFLLHKDGEHVAYLEVEIKRVWEGVDFKYEDVQFPERKWKYCKLDKPTVFMMINGNCTHYLCLDGDTMINSPIEMVRNRYIGYGEQFFKVPLKKVAFDDIMAVIEKLGL